MYKICFSVNRGGGSFERESQGMGGPKFPRDGVDDFGFIFYIKGGGGKAVRVGGRVNPKCSETRTGQRYVKNIMNSHLCWLKKIPPWSPRPHSPLSQSWSTSFIP